MPTVEEVPSYTPLRVLEYLKEQLEECSSEVWDSLQRAIIHGRVFLDAADEAIFFEECGILPGPSREFAAIANEIRNGVPRWNSELYYL
jgi:hypothetical protein